MLNQKGIVTSVEADKVTIMPLPSAACAGCMQSSCSKRHEVYIARNPKRLEVKIGATVEFGASLKAQAIEAVVALFLPIVVAALSYIISSRYTNSEGRRILSVLLGFALSCTLIAYLNRKRSKYYYTQILGVC